MEIKIKEEDFSIKDQIISKNSDLKQFLVNYVGNFLKKEEDSITVENILEVMIKEFPEFIQVLAEENFFRGYNQAWIDIDSASKELEKEKNE
jgi:hypothetical protein